MFTHITVKLRVMDTSRDLQASTKDHVRWKYYGRRQGAECQCYAAFYPQSGKIRDVQESHRLHVFEATGVWIQMDNPRG